MPLLRRPCRWCWWRQHHQLARSRSLPSSWACCGAHALRSGSRGLRSGTLACDVPCMPLHRDVLVHYVDSVCILTCASPSFIFSSIRYLSSLCVSFVSLLHGYRSSFGQRRPALLSPSF
jgi:hypothetical protein